MFLRILVTVSGYFLNVEILAQNISKISKEILFEKLSCIRENKLISNEVC